MIADLLHLTTKHRRILEALLREHLPDVEVWVYGSRVNGRSHDGSDLDLVLLGPGLKEISSGQLGDFKEAVRESTIPFLVEARDWARLPERFHREIERNFVVLVGDSDELYDRGYSGKADEWRKTVYGKFPSGFSKDSLENLCNHESGVQTGPFGSQLHKRDYVSNGTPILTVEHLGENRILHKDLPQVSDYDRERLYKYSLRKGDIVFSRVGSVDRRALVSEAEEGWLFSGRCLRVRPDPDKIDSGYLSYFFGQPMFQEHIRSIAVGATMPSLNTRILSDVEVYYPSLPEQCTIAHILGTLDDKIEMNRRINETLETMARAVFQDWFVDFGPVRAKMEGREPYFPSDLWDLFPDALSDDRKPIGWTTYTLAALACHHRATLSPIAEPERIYEHYSIPAYDAGNQPLLNIGDSIKSNKTIVPDGAVLLSKLNPDIERVWLPNPVGGAPKVASTEFLTLTPLSPATRGVLFCLFKSKRFRTEMAAMVTGTSKSHQRVSPKALLASDVFVADPRLMDAFDQVVHPWIDRLLLNRLQTATLAHTRDLLLSKLISGEIRTSQAENVIGAVA